MTTSQIIAAFPCGTASVSGNFLCPVKYWLQPNTKSVLFTLKTSFSDSSNNRSSTIKLWFAVSPTNYSTALDGCHALRQNAHFIELTPTGRPLIQERTSRPEDITFGWVYAWLEVPTLSAVTTVDAFVGEFAEFADVINVAPIPLSYFRTTVLLGAALPIKNGAGTIWGVKFINPNVTKMNVKFYDKVSSAVTVGTTPVLSTIPVPANDATNDGVTWLSPDNILLTFGSAISFACVNELADSGTTAPGSALTAEVYYK